MWASLTSMISRDLGEFANVLSTDVAAIATAAPGVSTSVDDDAVDPVSSQGDDDGSEPGRQHKQGIAAAARGQRVEGGWATTAAPALSSGSLVAGDEETPEAILYRASSAMIDRFLGDLQCDEQTFAAPLSADERSQLTGWSDAHVYDETVRQRLLRHSEAVAHAHRLLKEGHLKPKKTAVESSAAEEDLVERENSFFWNYFARLALLRRREAKAVTLAETTEPHGTRGGSSSSGDQEAALMACVSDLAAQVRRLQAENDALKEQLASAQAELAVYRDADRTATSPASATRVGSAPATTTTPGSQKASSSVPVATTGGVSLATTTTTTPSTLDQLDDWADLAA